MGVVIAGVDCGSAGREVMGYGVVAQRVLMQAVRNENNRHRRGGGQPAHHSQLPDAHGSSTYIARQEYQSVSQPVDQSISQSMYHLVLTSGGSALHVQELVL